MQASEYCRWHGQTFVAAFVVGSGVLSLAVVGGVMDEPEDVDEFERVRERAIEAIRGDDVESVYVGLVNESNGNEFYFGNDVDDEELREVAAKQLGMMTRVLAEQSSTSVEDVAALAVEVADEMDLRP